VAEDFQSVQGLELAGGINAFPWFADDPKMADFRDVMEQYKASTDDRDSASTGVYAALELFGKTVAERATTRRVKRCSSTMADQGRDAPACSAADDLHRASQFRRSTASTPSKIDDVNSPSSRPGVPRATALTAG